MTSRQNAALHFDQRRSIILSWSLGGILSTKQIACLKIQRQMGNRCWYEFTNGDRSLCFTFFNEHCMKSLRTSLKQLEGVKVKPEELEPEEATAPKAVQDDQPKGSLPPGTVLGDGKIKSCLRVWIHVCYMVKSLQLIHSDHHRCFWCSGKRWFA